MFKLEITDYIKTVLLCYIINLKLYSYLILFDNYN